MTVHKSTKCITPEGRRQMCLMKHRGNALRDSSVGSLCNSILMWFISECMLPLNATLLGMFDPFLGDVLSTFIISLCLDFDSKLVLSIGFELLECGKGTTLVFEW